MIARYFVLQCLRPELEHYSTERILSSSALVGFPAENYSTERVWYCSSALVGGSPAAVAAAVSKCPSPRMPKL
jgi:hypothetical protein